MPSDVHSTVLIINYSPSIKVKRHDKWKLGKGKTHPQKIWLKGKGEGGKEFVLVEQKFDGVNPGVWLIDRGRLVIRDRGEALTGLLLAC